MITALAIGGGITTALSLVVILLLVLTVRSSTADVLASDAESKLATQARFVAEAARDGFKARGDGLEKENKDLRDQLAATQDKLNKATKELVDRVQKDIVAANPGDAARIVDELLAQPLPGVPDPKGSAPADHGAGGAPAVQPATAAAAGDAGRRS